MSSALTGNQIKDSYQALLKIGTNGSLDPTTPITISDGLGNDTPISMSATLLNISTDFKLSSYGTGTHTGTATYNLAVDSVGNVIEISGGTTINPTDIVIPVRLNATTFVDSNIENDVNNYLKTSVSPTSGDYFGLFIDFGNLISSLGDINFNNGIKLTVDNSTESINTQNQGYNYGLLLDFANKIFVLGDSENNYNGTKFTVNDFNKLIQTSNDNGLIGLKLDFVTDLYSFADFDSASSGTSFYIDVANSTIYTQHSGQQEGLFFDFVNDYFQIGDFAGTNNGTYLNIDDDNKYINFIANPIEFIIDGLNGITKTTFNGNEVGLRFDYNNNNYSINTGIYSNLYIEDHIGTYSYITLSNQQSDDRGLSMSFDNHLNDTNYNLTLGSSANGTGLNLQFNPDSNVDFIQLSTRGGGNILTLDDISNKMSFTTNKLNFVGASLTDTTIVTPVGRNLKVTINGTNYHIPLYN